MDKHIRRLDSDLAKFEAEIKEKALNNNKKEEENNSKKSKFVSLQYDRVFVYVVVQL